MFLYVSEIQFACKWAHVYKEQKMLGITVLRKIKCTLFSYTFSPFLLF